MLNFQDLSIMARLRLVVLFGGVVLAVGIGLSLFTLSSAMRQDAALRTQSLVQTAASVADHYAQAAKAGRMGDAEAKADAVTALKAMRYGGNEYFWITDLDTRMVMHPLKPQLDGTDVSNLRDPKGKALFSAMTEVAKTRGAGFVDYLWPKPGRDRPQPKISYVQALPAWGWVSARASTSMTSMRWSPPRRSSCRRSAWRCCWSPASAPACSGPASPSRSKPCPGA